jgi:hypothetical protein
MSKTYLKSDHFNGGGSGQLLPLHLLGAVREEIMENFMTGHGAAPNFCRDLLLDGDDHLVLDHDCALAADTKTD